MNVFLSKPALLTALGDGLSDHLSWLFDATKSPLLESDRVFSHYDLTGKPGIFGEVRQPLRPFPAHLAQVHHSRNNQLLWHALAQIEPEIERCLDRFGHHRIAVVMGTSTTGVDENIPVFKSGLQHQDWQASSFNQQQQLFSAPADFVAAVYGLKGLRYGISTACTSGARALISAARLLKNDLCDAVICGGVDTLSPLTVSGFGSLSVLSPTQTNPFSPNRSGINIGEGAAAFVLTKTALEDNAIALLGYGSSSDAYHMSSPHPEGEGAIAAFANALTNANLSAAEIGWINLHGTGTLHNDQMEALAVAQTFGNQTACTSTKPLTGHTLGAAGAVEAAILWAVLNRHTNPHGKLPAQYWDRQADPTLPAIAITDHNSRWHAGRRIGASSSFAFGGNNSVLILGETSARETND